MVNNNYSYNYYIILIYFDNKIINSNKIIS